METINNIKGEYGVITHEIGTWFELNLKIQSIDDNKNITAYDLTDYTPTMKIYDRENGNELHEMTLTVSGSIISIDETIPITKSGNYFFEVKLTHDSIADKNWKPYYGLFEIQK